MSADLTKLEEWNIIKPLDQKDLEWFESEDEEEDEDEEEEEMEGEESGKLRFSSLATNNTIGTTTVVRSMLMIGVSEEC